MNDIISDLITKAVEGVNLELEQLLIERLKEAGHDFDTIEQLYEFAKSERCRVVKRQQVNGSYNCELYVDNIVIATWNDNIEIETKGNKTIITMNN